MMNLQESINEHGIPKPLLVRRVSKDRFKLIDGACRFACISDSDLKPIPCIIVDEPKIHMLPKH